MHAVKDHGAAAALPTRDFGNTGSPVDAPPIDEGREAQIANRVWEVDRAHMLARSERRAWLVAVAGAAFGLVGIAAVFVQGPLRRVVEIPIVVDRLTGETTIQQRLSVETIPPQEALDKHNLAVFVRAREAYSWMFLQRDYEQVSRMAVPAVFAGYSRQFEGDGALQKKLGGTEERRIQIVGVRLSAAGRTGNRGEATVTYDKVVHLTERALRDTTTRHVASVVFEYQPKVLAKEQDRLENPFGFVVTAYRSDPEINTPASPPTPPTTAAATTMATSPATQPENKP
jgi:type IV secretion system protein VirB8